MTLLVVAARLTLVPLVLVFVLALSAEALALVTARLGLLHARGRRSGVQR